MDAALKQRWIDALRSGDYEQAVGALRRQYTSQDVAYCCLGVLCAIQPDRYEVRQVGFARKSDNEWLDGHGLLPDIGNSRIRMPYRDEPTAHKRVKLANMNDRLDSFDVIADYIEKNL